MMNGNHTEEEKRNKKNKTKTKRNENEKLEEISKFCKSQMNLTLSQILRFYIWAPRGWHWGHERHWPRDRAVQAILPRFKVCLVSFLLIKECLIMHWFKFSVINYVVPSRSHHIICFVWRNVSRDYKLSLLLLLLLILQYYRPAQNRAKVSFDVRNIAFKKKAWSGVGDVVLIFSTQPCFSIVCSQFPHICCLLGKNFHFAWSHYHLPGRIGT